MIDDTIIPDQDTTSSSVQDGDQMSSDSGTQGDDTSGTLYSENTRLKEQLQRERADFMNYKKRIEEERKTWIALGEEQAVLLFLPLYENIHRALQSLPEDIAQHIWVQGVTQVEKKFTELIEKLEIELIPTIDADFNPAHHDAILQVAGRAGAIVQELESGYIRRGKVLKPAKVSVGK